MSSRSWSGSGFYRFIAEGMTLVLNRYPEEHHSKITELFKPLSSDFSISGVNSSCFKSS